jgi:CubicO group peptidase (beta-lactamase class C family)
MTSILMNELTPELLAQLNATVEGRISGNKCPSLFATVFQGEKNLFQAGIGEARSGAAVPQPDTSFRIASCTKSFTVTALLMLRNRGLLNLDASITDYVPEYVQANIGPNYEAPTLRMLMSMSGGLPADDPWADRQESISNAQLRDFVGAGVLITSAPGTSYQYSNLGYALLGQAIEAVTQRSYRDVVRDEILIPLGLNDSGYSADVLDADRLAHGFRRRDDEWVELPFSSPGAFSCIGGLFSSGRDLTTWVRWLSSAQSESPDESGPLSIASRREMQQIATAMPFGTSAATLPLNASRHAGYGFGLHVEHDEKLGVFVSHSGGYPGFSSHMRWHVPTGLGVVVLENATYSGAWETATTLIGQVLQETGFRLPNIEPWTQTFNMALQAESLIRNWNDNLTLQIFTGNVALDVPLDERKALIERLLHDVGGLIDPPTEVFKGRQSDSPLHLKWTLAAANGTLQCEVRLSPVAPSLIQTFDVSRI